jgi:hypothetical protein
MTTIWRAGGRIEDSAYALIARVDPSPAVALSCLEFCQESFSQSLLEFGDIYRLWRRQDRHQDSLDSQPYQVRTAAVGAFPRTEPSPKGQQEVNIDS